MASVVGRRVVMARWGSASSVASVGRFAPPLDGQQRKIVKGGLSKKNFFAAALGAEKFFLPLTILRWPYLGAQQKRPEATTRRSSSHPALGSTLEGAEGGSEQVKKGVALRRFVRRSRRRRSS